MIWDGCGDCKYAWPCGKDEDGDYKYLYCIPRERKCEFHFGNYRDKVCGLVEAISVGNLKKLLEGLDDSIGVDIWFPIPLTKLGKDDFFGKGTLTELYDWKDPNDQTEAEKAVKREMILQRNPDCRIDAKVNTEDLDSVCINPPSESDKESNESSTVYIDGDPKEFAYSSETDTSFFDANKVKDMKFNLPEVKLYNIESIAHNPEAPCIDHPYKGPCIDV